MKRSSNGGNENEKDAICAEWEKAALSRDLSRLADYCRELQTRWPTAAELTAIEDRVKNILRLTHQRVFPSRATGARPLWAAFKTLDKRMPSLRLVLRVDNLVKRAMQRLAKVGEPGLYVLHRAADKGNKDAENLVGDIGLLILDAPTFAKEIEWAQYERVLAQFSHKRSVEPACNEGLAASREVRCYTRSLELIVESIRPNRLWSESWPLVIWIAAIGHPAASRLKELGYMAAGYVEGFVNFAKNQTVQRKRELGRERTRRYRRRRERQTVKDSLPEKRYKTPI